MIKIKLYHPKINEYGRICSPLIEPHGYALALKFDAQHCWHLCNWEHWSEEKPENLFSDISHCNHGLIVYDAKNKIYWLALSAGWLKGNCREILDYLQRNWNKEMWFKDM